MGVLSFLFAASYVGRALGLASTWTVVFVIGASASATYLVLAPLALSEKFRTSILFTNMKRRVIILALVFGPVVAGISYWIYQAGSVEALPVFPYFIAIFYAWILSQAYFIANPVTHAMLKFEEGVVGKGFVKRMIRTLGMTVLFLPIAPLGVGVWEISSWANQNYANVGGAGTEILLWTMVVTLMIVATYFLTVMWGWKNIKNGKPQAAIFAGGTFLVVWGYLLYRATTLLMGLVSQNEPSNAIIDAGLMIVSILGAMQTFARKKPGASLPSLLFRIRLRCLPVLLHSSRVPHKGGSLDTRQRDSVRCRDLDSHATPQKPSQDSERRSVRGDKRALHRTGECVSSEHRRVKRLSNLGDGK